MIFIRLIGAWLILLVVAATGMASGAPLPREVRVNGVTFIHVPAGEFWHIVRAGPVGDDGHMDREYRNVRIWQKGYYIAKYEARASDFVRFMTTVRDAQLDEQYEDGATEGCSVQRSDDQQYVLMRPEDDLPVTHLSWILADSMARWMGFRLPTDAEWVKAARGTDQRIWPWGNEYPDDTFAGYESGSPCHPTPLDSYPNGASPYGVMGMAGGVFEYVADWYNTAFFQSVKDGDSNPYSSEPMPARSNTSGQMGELRYLRGGRWAAGATGISVYSTTTAEQDIAFRCYGVRFALDEDRVEQLLADGEASVVRVE